MDAATAKNQLADWLSEQRTMRAVGAIYYGEGEVERHHDQRILTVKVTPPPVGGFFVSNVAPDDLPKPLLRRWWFV